MLEFFFIQEVGTNVVVSSCIEKTPNKNHVQSMRVSSQVSSERSKVIILLKQEMESALVSLKETQIEMARLQEEKEELKASEKRSLSNLHDLTAQFSNLETVMISMKEQYENKMEATDHKLKVSNTLRCYDFSLFFFSNVPKLFYRLWSMNLLR